MGQSKRRKLSNLAVDCITVRAYPNFPALLVDLLADLCPLQVVDSWHSKLLQEGSSFGFGEKYSGAILATELVHVLSKW